MPKSVHKEARFRVMHLLQYEPNLSPREISTPLDIGLGIVNYCLLALVSKGQVKIRNLRAANSKLRCAFVLTSEGIATKTAIAGVFLPSKNAEYEALKVEIAALETELGDESGQELAFGPQDGMASARSV